MNNQAANPGNTNKPDPLKGENAATPKNHSEISAEKKPAQTAAAGNMQTSAGKQEIENQQKAGGSPPGVAVLQPDHPNKLVSPGTPAAAPSFPSPAKSPSADQLPLHDFIVEWAKENVNAPMQEKLAADLEKGGYRGK